MNKATIKTGVMFRSQPITRADINEEERTVKISFSSEEPVERWFGVEILDHSRKSVRLDRLNNGGALILEHLPRDQIGVVEKAWIGSDRRGRALVRFGRSGLAEEVFQDVLDGIRRNISVGYRIHRMVLEEEKDDGAIYRAMDWEPLEVSLVSIPADTSVGVDRAGDGELFETVIENRNEELEEVTQMPKEEKKEEKREEKIEAKTSEPQTKVSEIEEKLEERATKAEKERWAKIKAYAELARVPEEQAKMAFLRGISAEDFRKEILEEMSKKVKPIKPDDGRLDLAAKEVKQFSFFNLIKALASPTDRKAQEEAKFEFEVCEAFEKKIGKSSTGNGRIVPTEVMFRDLSVGTDTAGGYLVSTDLLADKFVEMLRNKLVVLRAGATVFSGLVGDVAIPKQTGGATAYWVAEDGSVTESDQTFGQIAMAPKTVGSRTQITRKLLLQSSLNIQNLVKNDLIKTIATAVDYAALHGSGTSNQPTGIINTTGIGVVAIGTNGGAPTWAHIINLEKEVAVDNADVGRLAYMTNAKVRGKLKQTFTNATYGEIPVWKDGNKSGVGLMNGYPAYVTNQVASDLTKGTGSNLSAIFFGNWADLIIGFWSGVDIIVNPYSDDASGKITITALQDCDIAVRHAESFAVIKDASTS